MLGWPCRRRRLSLGWGVVVVVSWVSAAVVRANSSPGYDILSDALPVLWSDEFNDASLNLDYWTPRLGNNYGWGNGELQVYTDSPDNLGIAFPTETATESFDSNGHLAIAVVRQDTLYSSGVSTVFTSARIDTRQKVATKYGRITARIQVPDTNAGLWPAFWTLGQVDDDSGIAWPATGEINIMEVGQGLAIQKGLANRRVVSAAHWQHGTQYATYAGWLNCPDVTTDYFHYTLDWTPTNLTTYLNNDLIWTMDITPEQCQDCEEFHRPHYLVLNMAVGGGFTSGGSSSSSANAGVGCDIVSTSSSSGEGGCGALRTAANITAPLPATLKVDYVRICDNGAGVELTVTSPPIPVSPPVPVPTTTFTPTAAPIDFDATGNSRPPNQAPIESDSISPPIGSPVDFDATGNSRPPNEAPINFDATGNSRPPNEAPIDFEAISPPIGSPIAFDSTGNSRPPNEAPIAFDATGNSRPPNEAPIDFEAISPPIGSPITFDATGNSRPPNEAPIDFDATGKSRAPNCPPQSPPQLPQPVLPIEVNPPTPTVDIIFFPDGGKSGKGGSKGGSKGGIGRGGGKSGKSKGSKSGSSRSSKNGKGSKSGKGESRASDYSLQASSQAFVVPSSSTIAVAATLLAGGSLAVQFL
jgi:beta-glucanase (GH16 family)